MEKIDKNTINKDISFWILIIIVFLSILLTCFYRDLFGMECRNALFAKEMLNRIKFIPTYLNIPYPDYTPIYFWLEVFFARLIGKLNTISVVLPSCLSFIGIITILYFFIKPTSKNLALLTAIIFSSFPKIWDASAHATIDMLLSFTISMTLIFLYIFERKRNEFYYSYIYLIIAIIFMIISFFVKGLIGIVLPSTVWNLYLFFKYKRKCIKRIFCFSLICLIIALVCQFTELYIDYIEYGFNFVKQVIALQITSRLMKQSNHSLLYYIFVTISCIFPWLLVLIYLILNKTKEVQITKKINYIFNNINFTLLETDLLLFGISWFLAIFIIFELASCKHSRYIYPAMPGLAICLAILIYKLYQHSNKLLIFIKNIALFIIFAPFIPIILRIKTVTLHIDLFILCIVIAFICWYLIKFISIRIRPWVYLGFAIIFLMSSFSLLFNTVYSQKQSGSQFMNCVNNKAENIFHNVDNIYVYVYKIRRDGNGVKLAYYASPDIKLKFINQNTLSKIRPPFILICYKKDSQKLLNILHKKYKTHLLCKGLVHMVAVEGFLITKGRDNE